MLLFLLFSQRESRLILHRKGSHEQSKYLNFCPYTHSDSQNENWLIRWTLRTWDKWACMHTIQSTLYNEEKPAWECLWKPRMLLHFLGHEELMESQPVNKQAMTHYQDLCRRHHGFWVSICSKCTDVKLVLCWVLRGYFSLLEINSIYATEELQKRTKKLIACDLQFFFIFFTLVSFCVYA